MAVALVDHRVSASQLLAVQSQLKMSARLVNVDPSAICQALGFRDSIGGEVKGRSLDAPFGQKDVPTQPSKRPQ